MRRVFLAGLALLIVLCAAVLRPRLLPRPSPLAHAPQGVTLICVEGAAPYSLSWISDLPNFSRVVHTGSIGLVPTRNGSPGDDDFAAGMQTLITGSRSPDPGEITLPDVVNGAKRPYTLRTFTGENAATDLESYLGTVTDPKNPTKETLVIVGVTPHRRSLEKRERVAPLIIWQRGMQPGLLTSPSTRNRPGLCALTDVAATVAALLDLPSDQQRIGDGRPVETLPRNEKALSDLSFQAIAWGSQAQEQKLLPVLPWLLAGLVLLATFVRNERLCYLARLVACALPVSLLCGFVGRVPAWGTYPVTVIVFAAAIGMIVQNPRWRSLMPRILAGATALVIAGDTLLGGPLLSRTPLSYSVLEAARFYGIGNEVSGLFLGSALVAVGGEAGALATLLWGLAVAVVSGAPTLGADAGGFVANLIAFAMLALLQRSKTGPRLDKEMLRRGIVAATCIVFAVTAFALWDGNRPLASQTHVGQLVAHVRTQGFSAAQTIIARKLRVNARLLISSAWAVLLAAEAIAFAVRRRKQKGQEAKTLPPDPVQIALTLATITLFALNDSGVVAGATCGLWLLALEKDESFVRSDSRP